MANSAKTPEITRLAFHFFPTATSVGVASYQLIRQCLVGLPALERANAETTANLEEIVVSDSDATCRFLNERSSTYLSQQALEETE